MTDQSETLEAGDLALIEPTTALAVLTDGERFDAFYKRVKAEVEAHAPDVSTQKGRDAIKSLAFKVVKTKTAIDSAGKALTDEWRTKTKMVDESRRAIRDRLDMLRDKVRKPLTEWEDAEAQRAADIEGILAKLTSAAIIAVDDEISAVEVRLAWAEALTIDDGYFQDRTALARSIRDQTVVALDAALERMRAATAERAELERLRQEAAEREARETQEKARLEQERANREREAAERAYAEARAAREAAEQEAADAKAAQARAEAEARTIRLEQEALARDAEEKRQADVRRAADVAHKSEIMRAAQASLVDSTGISAQAARAVLLAIHAGKVQNVSIQF